MADYGEIFCTAVNEIIKNQIAGLEYDITKDCTIISTKNKNDNEYMVSDGSSSFKAYAAEGASYALGDQVLVNIPKGDYNNQKTILNKVVNGESTPIGYKSPLDNFIKGSPNIISFTGAGIVANGPQALKQLWKLDNSDNLYLGFTHLALTGKFRTVLDNMGIDAGEYGLKLFVHGNGITSELTFSSSEMLGNPYGFNSYYYQETVFEIPSTITKIDSIELWLYQDGQFSSDGEAIEPIDKTFNNIYVEDIQIYLGFASGYATSEVVKLSADNLKYESGDVNRTLYFEWLHLLKDGVFEAINKSVWEHHYKDHCEIRWYQHILGCPEDDTDEYGGKNWQRLWSADGSFEQEVILAENKTVEQFKVIALYKTYPLHNNPTHEVITHYLSNIVEFENTTERTQGGDVTDEQIKSVLSLHFDDNSYGNYFKYDQNNKLIDLANEGQTRNRTISIWAYGEPIGESWEYYNDIDWIKWSAPVLDDNSMILCKDNMINPNEDLVSGKGFDEDILYNIPGTLEYSAQLNGSGDNWEKVNSIKILLSTYNGNNWNGVGNRPKTISISKQNLNNIKTLFTIDRAYEKLKLTYECYDKDREKIVDGVALTISTQSLKPAATFSECVKNIDDDVSFNYSIKDTWIQDRNNNIIQCTLSIKGVQHILTETLRFGPKGSSGTANTFLLEMLDGKNALTIKDENNKTLRAQAMLIGGNGKRIYFTDEEAAKIEWKLLFSNSAHMELKSWAEGSSKDIATLECKTNTIPVDNYAILQAKYTYPVEDVESKTTPILYAFLPIPLKIKDCIGISGPIEIIYDHQGLPSYGHNTYAVHKNDGTSIMNWDITQPTSGTLNPNPVSLIEVSVDTGEKKLSAASLYSVREEDSAIIQDRICVYSEGLWSQPILIRQSRYDFDTLNAWDGSLTTDEENGIILSTMLGAGKKNSDNQFSGVLIGDVQGGTGKEATKTMTGVYGFEDGIMTYGLQEDGSAFFGAYSNGRIEIDGTSGIIRSAGWVKPSDSSWRLKTNEDKTSGAGGEDAFPHIPVKATGSLFDLDNGMLIMQGDNSYFKFNADNDNTLKMQLHGANIVLTDKTNTPGLSGYIDATAKGLVTEFRRTAIYAVTCSTRDNAVVDNDAVVKQLNLSDFTKTDFFKSDKADDDNTVGAIGIEDIEKDGVTIAVTFTYAQTVQNNKVEITQDVGDNESQVIGYKDKLTGKSLYLQLSGGEKRAIYINNKATNATPSLDASNQADASSNPYGWAAGSTIYFTYKDGYWEVSDSGSYSKITQTADMIKTEVSNISGTLGSAITQTAGNIRMEVAKKESHSCTCDTEDSKDNSNNKIKIINEELKDSSGQKISDKLSPGCILNIKFTKQESVGTGIEFKVNNIEYSVSGTSITWKANETIPFMYNGTNFIMTSLSNAYIDVKADSITSEVRRTAGYGCTASCPKGNELYYADNFTMWKINEIYGIGANAEQTNLSGDDLLNAIKQSGITLAITFDNSFRSEATKESAKPEIWLELPGGNGTTQKYYQPVYLRGAITGTNNKLTIKPYDTIYFSFVADNTAYGGHWNVVDSGAYSKITQLADSINAQVLSTNGAQDITKGFAWDLTDSSFALQTYNVQNRAWNDVFKCNKDGIYINGSGTFTGEITATSLTLGSGVKIPYAQIEDQPDLTVYISKGGVVGSTPGENTTGFQVSSQGALKASNAIIYGTIYATAGKIGGCSISNGQLKVPAAQITGTITAGAISTTNFSASSSGVTIGGWTVGANSLTKTNASPGNTGFSGFYTSYPDNVYTKIAGQSSNSWRLIVGSNFGVDNQGNLYCSGGAFSGSLSGATLTGATGTIGGWSIGSGKLIAGAASGGSTTTGSVEISKAGVKYWSSASSSKSVDWGSIIDAARAYVLG